MADEVEPAEHRSVALRSLDLLSSAFLLGMQSNWRGDLLQGFWAQRAGVAEVL